MASPYEEEHAKHGGPNRRDHLPTVRHEGGEGDAVDGKQQREQEATEALVRAGSTELCLGEQVGDAEHQQQDNATVEVKL
jgi:hypothetical protein